MVDNVSTFITGLISTLNMLPSILSVFHADSLFFYLSVFVFCVCVRHVYYDYNRMHAHMLYVRNVLPHSNKLNSQV